MCISSSGLPRIKPEEGEPLGRDRTGSTGGRAGGGGREFGGSREKGRGGD